MAVRPTYFAVFITLIVILHFILHLAFGFEGSAPQLVTVAALLGARRLRPGAAAGVGFGLGVLEDALSVTSFGASAFALTLVCYLGARSRDLFEGESVPFLLLYLFLGTWLRDVLVFLVSPGAPRVETMSRLVIALPLIALYAAAAGVTATLIYRAVSGERA